MTLRRSSNLRRINLTIGAILVVAGVAGGYLLTFWLLMLLLPITCVAASWMMASTVQPGQEVHVVGAMIVTAVFIAWLWILSVTVRKCSPGTESFRWGAC